MNETREQMCQQIHAKVTELVRAKGMKPQSLTYHDVLPETGLLDSAGLMEFLIWFEIHYRLTLEQEDITLDNLGTIERMADFAIARCAG